MKTRTNTVRAMMLSLISLVLCIAMLAGTTFAWFTDTVESEGNIIKTGKLKVEMYYKGYGETVYKDASRGAIFNWDNWEPGYIDCKMIKVVNSGSLAFKYTVSMSANTAAGSDEVDLAEVIDVYLFGAGVTLSRDVVNATVPVCTLAELLTGESGLFDGVLLPVGSEGDHPVGETEFYIVLKMRDDAGNEYMDLTAGGGITVKLVATQYTWENDVFGDSYDKDASDSMNSVGGIVTEDIAGGDGEIESDSESDSASESESVGETVSETETETETQTETETETETETDDGIIVRNEEFLYGSYFDNDRYNYTKDRLVSGDYIKIRSHDALLPVQDITIKVTDNNLENYKVTLGYYDAEGNYKGRTGILTMTDGVLTIKGSTMSGPYVRVNVYIYNGRFTKVPEDAVIVVYGKYDAISNQPTNPDQTESDGSEPGGSETDKTEPDGADSWRGKKITVLGDSISTGGYVNNLANMTGATLQNLSVSGTLLAGGISGRVSEVDSDADLIIVFGGTNDYWHKNVTIGTPDSTDTRTYYGALNYILKSLKENNPNAEYLFVFPADQTFSGNASSTDFGKGSLDDFRAAFLDFCTTNGVDYVNLAETDYDCSIHASDGVHPNAAGHQIIAQAIYDAITKE